MDTQPNLSELYALPSDLAATVDHCAHELRQIGDRLYWRYKLLEILIKNYKTVTNIKWERTSERIKRNWECCETEWEPKQKSLRYGLLIGGKMVALKRDVSLWKHPDGDVGCELSVDCCCFLELCRGSRTWGVLLMHRFWLTGDWDQRGTY